MVVLENPGWGGDAESFGARARLALAIAGSGLSSPGSVTAEVSDVRVWASDRARVVTTVRMLPSHTLDWAIGSMAGCDSRFWVEGTTDTNTVGGR